MHKFTKEQIVSTLDCLNRSQPQVSLPASVLGCIRITINYALLPDFEQIDDSFYLAIPGTNLTLIARPAENGRYHWSGLTKDGTIYNNDLVELAHIFLREDGREREFLVEQVEIKDHAVWLSGRFDFRLNGGAA